VGPKANQQVSAAETERMMKVQEVILKAMAGSLKWSDAAEIIEISDRSLRRWRRAGSRGTTLMRAALAN
jgi:hypothetical protein